MEMWVNIIQHSSYDALHSSCLHIYSYSPLPPPPGYSNSQGTNLLPSSYARATRHAIPEEGTFF